MKKFLFTLIALAVGAAAYAGDATGSFNYPTAFVDGTPLAQSQIASVRVEYSVCSAGAFGTKLGEVTVTPPTTAWSVLNLTPGTTYCFRAYTRTTPAVGGLDSAYSATVSKLIPFVAPNPPTLNATITVAYELVPDKWDGVRLGRNVGTVKKGTACEPNEVLPGFYEVARDNVSLTKTPKSQVLVTRCEWS